MIKRKLIIFLVLFFSSCVFSNPILNRFSAGTNDGDMGNAHSEYIGPLTEQGVPGALLALCFPAVVDSSHPLLMRMAFLRLHVLIVAVAVFLWTQKKPLPQDARKAFHSVFLIRRRVL